VNSERERERERERQKTLNWANGVWLSHYYLG
jgi:hypothetical protein